jgi:hypothetical protein
VRCILTVRTVSVTVAELDAPGPASLEENRNPRDGIPMCREVDGPVQARSKNRQEER